MVCIASHLSSSFSLYFLYLTGFRVLIVFSGSEEREGSSTLVQARQVRRWQTEEEGSTHKTLIYSLNFHFIVSSLCFCLFLGKKLGTRKVLNLWLMMWVCVCGGFCENRSGVRGSRRRRWTTWCYLTRLPMTSFFLKLPNTNSSPLPFSLIVWGYFSLFYSFFMLLLREDRA